MILSESCFASPLIHWFLFVKILLSNVSYLIFIISISLRIIFPPNCLSCRPCPSLLEPSSTILRDPLYMLLHAPVPKLFLGGANLTSPNLLTTMQAKSNSVITCNCEVILSQDWGRHKHVHTGWYELYTWYYWSQILLMYLLCQ